MSTKSAPEAVVSHTPGPWTIKPVFIAQVVGEAICFSEYRMVIDGHDHLITYRETAQANARLIAAAPELLEALRRICAIIPLYRNNLNGNFAKTIEQVADAAIAKATGGTE